MWCSVHCTLTINSIMRLLYLSLGVAIISALTAAQTPGYDEEAIHQIQDVIDSLKTNATLASEFDDHFKYWNSLDTSPNLKNFSCDSKAGLRSATRPSSVHQLRPGDIDVVAALGDSITAAFGAKAKTPLSLVLEWRGESWSIGGDGSVDDGVFTLPNMLKKFNPNLKGYSTGVIPVFTENILKSKSRFNAAVSGAKSKNMLAQAEKLVARMKADHTVDVDNDWKLITLFIGGNDLCAYCKDEKTYSSHTYSDNIVSALNYLQKNLPRTLVNIVPMLDLTQLSEVNSGLVCNILHRFVCKCGSFPASQIAKRDLIEEVVEYSESVIELLSKHSFDGADDFTVVTQPFLINQRLPTLSNGKPDLSYFAPDCFHFSIKGHAISAQALWNNMFEPAGKKRLSWFRDESWNCPSDKNPFIFTYRNSGYQSQSEALNQELASQSNDMLGDQSQASSKRQADVGTDLQFAEEFVDPEIPDDDDDTYGPYYANQNTGGDDKNMSVVLPVIGGFIAGVLAVALVVMMARFVKRRRATRMVGEKTALLQ